MINNIFAHVTYFIISHSYFKKYIWNKISRIMKTVDLKISLSLIEIVKTQIF